MEGISDEDYREGEGAIRAGEWRHNSQAKDWIGHAVAKALGLGDVRQEGPRPDQGDHTGQHLDLQGRAGGGRARGQEAHGSGVCRGGGSRFQRARWPPEFATPENSAHAPSTCATPHPFYKKGCGRCGNCFCATCQTLPHLRCGRWGKQVQHKPPAPLQGVSRVPDRWGVCPRN